MLRPLTLAARRLIGPVCFAALCLAGAAGAQGVVGDRIELMPPGGAEPGPAAPGREVDVELYLAVDVSYSMSRRELEIQRRGYAEALRSPEVVSAIEGGMIGAIALTYVEWAGVGASHTVIDWTRIASAEDARGVAKTLMSQRLSGMRRTSISGALLAAAASFDGSGYEGLRRVIDVSGDGPNNQGPWVTEARDSILDRGIVINGLPLMTDGGFASQLQLSDLDLYYRDCVIGGPGAFVVPVREWSEFAAAVRRKLIREIAGTAPMVIPAQAVQDDGTTDCRIGERLWRQYRRNRAWP